ncbi:hypothetical protein CDAR_448741 [Caerostris darwini]|uniref:Uncharacterized protein n=1 Tax=Caerostris darwini TaxID=1538125 RepID=A0AAV4QM57_9ARAC|nr:hypothetical protein CDAR_448741 [Caerostris darwini]
MMPPTLKNKEEKNCRKQNDRNKTGSFIPDIRQEIGPGLNALRAATACHKLSPIPNITLGARGGGLQSLLEIPGGHDYNFSRKARRHEKS